MTVTRKITRAWLARLFWSAANEHLAIDDSGEDNNPTYSCLAVFNALNVQQRQDNNGIDDNLLLIALDHWFTEQIEALGLDPERAFVFAEFPPGPERQGARYAWLMHLHTLAQEGYFVGTSYTTRIGTLTLKMVR